MNTLQEDYNTQREPLNISEYGRIIQDYVTHIQTLPSKDERTRWVSSLVEVMTTLNPNLKQQTDYEKVLWGYVHQISGFSLDVDAPFPYLPRKKKPKNLVRLAILIASYALGFMEETSKI